jgi:transposase
VVSTCGLGSALRQKVIPAGCAEAVRNELARARLKFGLAPDAPVVSRYEAGRDGVGPHRLLATLGVQDLVLDAASIEVPRRRHRAKTDRLDGVGRLRLPLRCAAGYHRALRAVHVPSLETEARRHLHREMQTVQRDRQRVRNRVLSLVVAHGARLRLDAT